MLATAAWSGRTLAAPSGRAIVTDGVHSGDVPNTSPLADYQFFGEVQIDGASGVPTVTSRDLHGVVQSRQPMLPHGAA
ncbi:hypothetical protein [Xanthomonas fragariae]|uniref:hypothetical protein n=1 Tax=Xanthomonas fragariae TaxID=48664 RepID=UPI0022AA205E|nr:hypothetical protein [Xanthomonas fragariae]WAT16670.1 hypothetical protein OZ429_18245 [Xanthomonas fragariae]